MERICKGLVLLTFLIWGYSKTTSRLVAQTPITTINTNAVTTGLTTSNYVATSPSDASGDVTPNTAYTVNYGQVQNLLPTSYVAGGVTYDRFVTPDTLIIRRTDAGRQLIIFYEFDNVDNTNDIIDIDAEQQDNEEALYQSGLLNAGYDNILVNSATNFANVERIDILYYTGVVTSSPSTAVFPIVERGGNDDIKVAAIKALDANGDPSEYYSTVVQVNNNGTSDWGDSGIGHLSLVMRRQDATSDPLPQTTLGSQNIHGSAVSFSDFGVAADEIVYGYSIFADDVDESTVDITDITEYPTNTGSASGLDLIAGISTAVASDDNLTKSTGPGGYKADLDTWLKANNSASVTTSTDGSTVTDWQDEWLGDHDATTLTSAPTYRDGTASSADDINFNPTVDFLDATERGLQIANNTDFNTATSYTTKGINIAIRTGNDITTKQQIYEQGSNDRGINMYIRAGALYVGAWNIPNTDGTGDNWGFSSTNTSSIATETEYIITLEFDGNSGVTGTVTAYLNGQSFGTISSVGLLFADTGGIGLGDTNSQSRYDDGTTAAASFYGSIPEFIYCNTPSAFNSTQRNKIESYLAVKYGITLDQTSPVNYVNSDGSVIFNTTLNASLGGYLEYNNDIAGIGRDDNSEFVQLQSQSENTGSIVEVNRTSSIGTDDTWLLWGNDGGVTTSSRIVTKPDTINERLERVWRVAEENSVGVTDISFDITGLGFGTDAGDFSLLIADNSSGADFSSATVVTGGTFNGDVITFSDVNLSDGQYFTLGTQYFICTPGGVQDGLALWLKADAETFNTGTTLATNGQTVETWADQSRSDFDATNDGGVTNRAPTWVETDVNFNPGLNWNAGADEIGFTLGSNFIFAAAADGGMHIFSSVEPESSLTGGNRNNKWIYNFGNNNNSGVGIAAYGDRGNIVADGKTNFNISPTAASFLAEGDFNTNAGTSDVKNHIVDGTIVSANTGVDIDIDDSGITQASAHGSNQGPVSIGRQSETNNLGNNSGRRFFGDMQEVIVYNQDISAIEAQRVRSYLAIKYGTTLTDDNDADATPNETISGSVVEGDYVASDGTTITWDYSDDTGFVSNVAGIGRDDDTCLNQKQSRSVNTGAIVTMGLGGIATNNAGNANDFTADKDFLTWATDGASTAFGSITTAGTPGTVNERMLRIWRAQETGTVGATDISFDLTGLTGYSSNAGDYQLITASGGDNTSLENGNTITGGTFNGSVLTFSGVDLTDGQYFTLGVSSDLCGPGGVTSGMVLWLRSDAGTSTTTDNTSITTWTDQSTASNDATEVTNPPLYKSNATDNINFLPTIDFDGTNDILSVGDLAEIKSATGTGRYTMLGIGLRQDANDNYVLGSTGGTNNEELYFGYTSAGTTATLDHESNAINLTGLNAFGSPAQTPFLLFGEYDGTGRVFEELRDDNFNRNTDSNTTDISGTQTNYIGDVTNTGNYNGLISEVLVYNSAVTDLEKLRIYSYFGVKYGITLPQDNDNDLTLNETISGSVAEGDYVASDGTTIIWDESNGYSTYHNGMAGIGRDDDACLNQKQSTSATDGTILTMGLGSVETDNATNSNLHDNLDFLIWGHDGGATAQASANTVDVPSTISERMTRVWRVEDNGTVGNTELQFDLSTLGYSVADASAFSLLISNTSTIADASITTGGTLNGSVLSFTGVDLTDGQFFTIGTAFTTCGPGGVNTNIGLWLRADLEVFSDAGVTAATDGGDVAQWNDQSSPASNTSEANGGGGSVVEPLFRATEINYNSSVFVSDQNTTNNSFMETAAATNTVSGDMTLIAIFETAQNQGTNDQIDNTPALIGAEADAGTDDYGLGVYQGEVVFNAANTTTFTARSTTATYNDGEPYMATGTRVQAASGAVNLYINSLNVGTGTSDNTALDAADTWAVGNQSSYDNEAQFQGNISEVLVFSSVLSGEEQARVESYLALKYGITRSDDNDGDLTANEIISGSIREGDYVAADGGIIWDYSARGSTYFNDIAGIGRDDLSCFDQTRSKSENDDALVDMEITSFTADDSWLIWGNDGAVIEAIDNKERPAGINSRLNREWQVQETGTVGSISLTYDLSTINGPTGLGTSNLTQLRLMVDGDGDFNSGVTLLSPTSTDAINNTVTFTVDFNGSDGFYYTLGSEEEDALPITLVNFSANKTNDNDVLLEWTTAQEVNNSFFTIERSTDAINFESLSQIDGAGSSDEFISYHYTDRNPLDGTSYYRLRQTDHNGESSASETLRVFIEPVTLELVRYKVYPNPVHRGEELTIERSGNLKSAILSYQIYSPGGVFVKSGQIESTLTGIKLETKDLNPGVHLIRILGQDTPPTTLKVIVR
ncbi:MAG: T9SS type A sorting domain-containing protein [Roseivirga sp.]|nr:T9SS type A sorting domain-containing protein [Roseivirga sp.]